MSSIKTYNASVRVGNWFEDCQLEEDTIKHFLERKERGELISQKVGKLFESAACNLDGGLSTSADGCLHFGDCIQLKNPGADQHLVSLGRMDDRSAATLCISFGENMLLNGTEGDLPDPSPVSADRSCKLSARSLFIVTSVDGTPDGRPVKYSQPFQLKTHPRLGNQFFLVSERQTFGETTQKHGHQPVQLTSDTGFSTHWKMEFFNPQLRMEFEGSPVQVNERVIVKHAKTNNSLAIEEKHFVNGLMGPEFSVSANTFFNDHKAEKDVNHWILVTNVPQGATGQEH